MLLIYRTHIEWDIYRERVTARAVGNAQGGKYIRRETVLLHPDQATTPGSLM